MSSCTCRTKQQHLTALYKREGTTLLSPHGIAFAMRETGATFPPRYGWRQVDYCALGTMFGNLNLRTRLSRALGTDAGQEVVAKVGFCPVCVRDDPPKVRVPREQLRKEADQRVREHVTRALETHPEVDRVVSVEGPIRRKRRKGSPGRWVRVTLVLRSGSRVGPLEFHYGGQRAFDRYVARKRFEEVPRFVPRTLETPEQREALAAEVVDLISTKFGFPKEHLQATVMTAAAVRPEHREAFLQRFRGRDTVPVHVALVVPNLLPGASDPYHRVDLVVTSLSDLREACTLPFGHLVGAQRDYLRAQSSYAVPLRQFQWWYRKDKNGKARPRVAFEVAGHPVEAYRWEVVPSDPLPDGAKLLGPLHTITPRFAYVCLLRTQFAGVSQPPALKWGLVKERVHRKEPLPPEIAVLEAVVTGYRAEVLARPLGYEPTVLLAVRADLATARAIDREVKRRTREHILHIANGGDRPRGYTEFRTLASESTCRQVLEDVAKEKGLSLVQPANDGWIAWSRLVGSGADMSVSDWVRSLSEQRRRACG
ncbi:hypothetical protein [Deferrisoma palaeochoriense]